MLKAFLFDFNATLIHAPAWMALEVRTLPKDAFSYLAKQRLIEQLDPTQLSQAESVFQNARQRAEETGYETSHIEDLGEMVTALNLQDKINQESIFETVEILHRRCVSKVTLFEGARETLQQLQTRGYRLGIVSNAAYSPFLTWTLQDFGVTDFFEHIVVSADVRTRKPNPEIFQITLNRMSLRPIETVYVGDDIRRDIMGAQNAGMRAIWFRPGGDSTSADDKIIPDATVADLPQVISLAERWMFSF